MRPSSSRLRSVQQVLPTAVGRTLGHRQGGLTFGALISAAFDTAEQDVGEAIRLLGSSEVGALIGRRIVVV